MRTALGEVHQGDPGFSFYPLVIAWRTTPVTWLGITALLILAVWAWRKRVLSGQMVKLLLTLGVFAVVYGMVMSLGAKKFDRYILPVFPVIALFAGIGFWLLGALIAEQVPKVRTAAYTTLLVVIAVGQSASVLATLPYRLDYYSPILGGNEHARDALQMGWGQGGKEVVDYIIEHSAAGQPLVLRAPRVPQAFSYFLPDGSSVQLQNSTISTAEEWYETDWVVIGIQQTQRNIDETQHLLEDYEPAHVVSVEGVPYFWIYTPAQLPLPSELEMTRSLPR